MRTKLQKKISGSTTITAGIERAFFNSGIVTLGTIVLSLIVLKALGSIISKLISAIGLKSLDKLLGAFFSSLKVLAILSSLFVFNMNYLDKNQWWLDSYSRTYSISFYEYSKPIFDEWIDKVDIILQKDDSKIEL